MRVPLLLVGMGVPPQHQLLDDEEHAEPEHQRPPDGMGAGDTGPLDGFREQRQKRRPKKSAGSEAQKMRQDPGAALLGDPQERDRESSARDPAQGRAQDDPQEQRHGSVSSWRVTSTP